MNIKKPKNIQFTKVGYEKMEKEFKTLTEERKKILVRLQTAREMGDLSENGAYTAARFELGKTDRRLRRLKYLLQYGKVVEAKHKGSIDFGSKVTLEKDKKQLTFTLVNKYESDPKKQQLSTDSPFGKAVLGKKSGDKVSVTAPAGNITYTIVKVE